MFGLLNNAYKSVRKKQEKRMTIVLLGLDSAGKTTLLHTLKVASQRAAHGKRRHDPRMRMATVTSTAEEAAFVARPTLGFEESSLQISGYACAVYDLGGSRLGRVNWPSYLDEVHAIVFVVDAADSARLDEAKEVLHATLRNAHVAGKPVLVLANKLDLPGALPAAELAARLELPDVRASPHQVHAVTAAKLDDARTFKAFKWLGSVVASDYPALHARVDKDVAEKKRLEELERTERKKRIEERKAQRDKERADKDAAARAGRDAARATPGQAGASAGARRRDRRRRQGTAVAAGRGRDRALDAECDRDRRVGRAAQHPTFAAGRDCRVAD